jgi:hypothetical protein
VRAHKEIRPGQARISPVGHLELQQSLAWYLSGKANENLYEAEKPSMFRKGVEVSHCDRQTSGYCS